MTKQLKVFGDFRHVPDSFPGPRGMLTIGPLAPPEDVGAFRCIPAPQARHDNLIVEAVFTQAFKPFIPPSETTVLASTKNPDGAWRVGDTQTFVRDDNNPHTSLFKFFDDADPTMPLLGIWWDGATLSFRLGERQASLPLDEVRGFEGSAHFYWTPERIWILYRAMDTDSTVMENSSTVTIRN